MKRIISIMIAVVIITTSACASILGSENIKHSEIKIGHGATLVKNTIYSDQNGVGPQRESYVVYSPNTSLVPAVINNSYLCTRLATSAKAKSLIASGKNPAMIVNADFFSLEMGFPISHQIIDREIIVKDYTTTDAIGFNSDGTAFIAPLTVKTEIKVGDKKLYNPIVNMSRKDWGIYLFTDDFHTNTKAKTKGVHVVIGSLSGRLTVGETIKGTVEDVYSATGEIDIPAGKMILTVDSAADASTVELFKSFKAGDEVKISSWLSGDPRWVNAKYILGAPGGRLLNNSEIAIKDAAAAPRTAIGIKSDGTIIFYTIDGRQQGYSYGVRLVTLAQRMKELGCVDAINLDGGGSTTIGIAYPGGSGVSIVNSPSDGSERKIPNYIALINKEAAQGNAEKLFLYPYEGNYLSGTEVDFETLATDKHYYYAAPPQDITYTSPDGTVSTNGKVKITGNGAVTVTAKSGNIEGSVQLNSYTTPTYIAAKNKATDSFIDSLSINNNNRITIEAHSGINNKYLVSSPECYKWECSKVIGSIDSKGNFTAADRNAKGTITISAGSFSRELPVSVKKNTPYTEVFFDESSNRELSIELCSADGITVDKNNIVLKLDGYKEEVNLNGNKINLTFNDTVPHKVTLQLVNSEGKKTFATYVVKGTQIYNPFVDVAEDYWARDYIAYMHYHGVVNGKITPSGRQLIPAGDINRGEFAVMVANMLKLDSQSFENVTLNMADENQLPSWCRNHIKAVCAMGIMSGKQNNGQVSFDWSAALTRAEAVTVLSNILPENMEIKNAEFADSSSIPFWSEAAFRKLYSLGIVNGYSDNTIRPMNYITRAEVIKMLYEAY